MIRGVEINPQDEIIVRLTPTYSGCPATDLLKAEISQAFAAHELTPVKVVVDLSEAWTTDWMSEEGKQKLQQYGIAPPKGGSNSCGTHVALSDGIQIVIASTPDYSVNSVQPLARRCTNVRNAWSRLIILNVFKGLSAQAITIKREIATA